MRKVYQANQSAVGVALSLAASVGLTVALFGFLPFSAIVAKPTRTLELRKAAVADLPPPTEPEPPPVLEESPPPPEAPAPPQLTDAAPPISLGADLDVAMGSGGALAGFGEVRAPTAVAAVAQDTFDVTELERRPEPISQVPPAYPAELRKARIEGVVALAFVLNETGKVEDARVESSTRPEFDKPALEAIRKWRFRPGLRDGQPVRTYVRVPMRFRAAAE